MQKVQQRCAKAIGEAAAIPLSTLGQGGGEVTRHLDPLCQRQHLRYQDSDCFPLATSCEGCGITVAPMSPCQSCTTLHRQLALLGPATVASLADHPEVGNISLHVQTAGQHCQNAAASAC